MTTMQSTKLTDGTETTPVLQTRHVSKHYHVRNGVLKAVDDVSLDVAPGTTLGIVGESGCGKTTLSRLLLRLEEPTSGDILFHGKALSEFGRGDLKEYRRKVSAVFQDPYASLNPRHRVEELVLEPVKINLGRKGASAGNRAHLEHLLSSVGLPNKAARLYPHEFSGGQRQRIAIARALALTPDVVVLDEPVSALDVSIRAQILNLLRELQRELGVAFLFIAHDLAAVRHMSDEIAVMYLGAVVERGPVEVIYTNPAHPYTRGLLEASLPPDPRHPNLTSSIEGELPSPISPPSGCRFRTRCPFAADRCAEEPPDLRELGDGRVVACHFAEDVVASPSVAS